MSSCGVFCTAFGYSDSVSLLCCSTVRQPGLWGPLPGRREPEGISPWHSSRCSPGGGAASGPIGPMRRVGAGATARRHCLAFHSGGRVRPNEQVINHPALFVSLVQAIFWYILTQAKTPWEFLSGFCCLKAFAALAVALFDKDGEKKILNRSSAALRIQLEHPLIALLAFPKWGEDQRTDQSL